MTDIRVESWDQLNEQLYHNTYNERLSAWLRRYYSPKYDERLREEAADEQPPARGLDDDAD